MTSLADLQSIFQAGILQPEDDRVLGYLNDSAKEIAPVLYGAYRYAYSARLVEVMQANYDKTWTLLGDDGFDAAARAYISGSPSQVRNARWFGEGFSAFLRDYYPDLPGISDVAAIDWAIAAAFDAADAPVATVDAMAAIHPNDWPALTFSPASCVYLIPVSTPAADTYQALSDGEGPGALDGSETAHVVVWRDGLTVRYRAVEPGEAAAWRAVSAGETFAAACEAVADIVGADLAGVSAAGYLRSWLETGMISAINFR